jgi:NAD(P)-dependent dehydrogenase (short-subunit alcohol dehydrogenase family)
MARIALITGGMGGLGEAVCMKMAALTRQVMHIHLRMSYHRFMRHCSDYQRSPESHSSTAKK